MKSKLPYLIKSFEGDSAIKVRLKTGRFAVVDLQTILGLVEPDGEDRENCKSMMMLSWGVLHTQHSLLDLQDLLYPGEFGDFE